MNLDKTEWVECFKDIIDTNKFSDIVFKIQNEEEHVFLQAHRLILSMASPVFEIMFNGSLPEKEEVTITDCDPTTFKIFLKYIYFHNIKFNSYIEAKNVYYLAEKYMLPNLKTQCSAYLVSNFDSYSVVEILLLTFLYEDGFVKEKAIQYIKKHLKDVFKNEKFYNLSPECIAHIFSMDDLYIKKEVILFDAVVKYADIHNINLMYNPDLENQNEIVKILQEIRFLNMSQRDFIKSKGRLRFFSDSDSLAIICNIAFSKNADMLNMPEMPNGLSKNIKSRYYDDNHDFDEDDNRFTFYGGLCTTCRNQRKRNNLTKILAQNKIYRP